MNEALEDLKQRMSVLSDERLKEIVEKETDSFEEYAIELAKKELESRALLKIPIYMTFQDLINRVDFGKVVEEFETRYPEKLIFLDDFRAVYEKLSAMTSINDIADFLHIENDRDIQTAFGEDSVTGEKYGVEFCAWSDWLSYRLKPEQVSELGEAAYTAVCLITLTSYGFTEEEIQRQLDLLKNDAATIGKAAGISGQDLLRFEPVTLDRSLEKISGYKDKLISDIAGRNEAIAGRPWVRFWARMLDSSTIMLLIGAAMLYFVPLGKYIIAYFGSTFFSVIKFLFWTFIEALFISRLGWTPGKWLLNIRVLKSDGSKLSYLQALNRTLLVMLLGEGLFIPVITLITNIISYSALKRNGITKWDEKLDVTVTHGKIEPYRIIMAAVIIVGVPLLHGILIAIILPFMTGGR